MPARDTEAAPDLLESLDLVGLGVNVETLGNRSVSSDIWQAVHRRPGRYLISQARSDYPGNLIDAALLQEQRARAAITTSLRHFMDSYPLPLLVAGASIGIPDNKEAHHAARVALAGSFVTPPEGSALTAAGVFTACPDLEFQRGQVLRTYLNNQPDLMWDILFHTMQMQTDAPLIGMCARDGIVARATHLVDADRPAFDSLFADATRPKLPGVLSDSCTFLTLAKRSRVDALRPFANSRYIYDRMRTVSHNGQPRRTSASCFDGWRPGSVRRQATPYLQHPWTAFQVLQFDSLPQLGTVYRPHIASYRKDETQLVDLPEQRLRFETALQAVLTPLDGRAPARVLFDYGSVWNDRTNPGLKQFGWLGAALKKLHPEIDLYDPTCGIDLAQCLGDLGAGSPFVTVALAAMASLQAGGATLIANLRRQEGASLMLVEPPSDAQRKKDAAVAWPLQPSFYNK